MIFAEHAIENELPVEEDLINDGVSADKFEGYSEPHSERIADLSDRLAIRFNFAVRDRLMLKRAAYFHDFGELAMNRAYISSASELTEAERLDLFRHPVIGEQQASKRDLPRAVQLLVRWHHEWWNGFGYPDKLIGKQIPLAARILRIADTYCALTSVRPFREAFSPKEADIYIAESAGIEFDPAVALALLDIPERIPAAVPETAETAAEEEPGEE
ncbi:MAG: HD domain-containing protein [Acidobacteriota bacterium]|nr:MAG: HD domain-containing protein [Acidobacteriota bacterium]